MTENKFTYNNEVICMIGIMSVLDHIGEMSYGKIMILTPLIFNNRIVKWLNKNTVVRSFDEFRLKQIAAITDFNKQYYNYLTLSVNTLVILAELDFIELAPDVVKLKKKLIDNADVHMLGNRVKAIIKIAPKLVNIINEKEEKIYSQLGVEL